MARPRHRGAIEQAMSDLTRRVRGVLFVDYVKMLKAQKGVDWRQHLPEQDLLYLAMKVDPDAWYPMATFERMGNQILRTTARGAMFPVQLWGRFSASQLRAAHPNLLAPGDPIETLNRFRVMRETFFDFPALEVPVLHDEEAQIIVRYHMGMPAEEAAAYQTMGFFEGLLELAGVRELRAAFRERSWDGDARTLIAISWQMPAK
jgi:hypothetical protein